jgi:hypothetical protein
MTDAELAAIREREYFGIRRDLNALTGRTDNSQCLVWIVQALVDRLELREAELVKLQRRVEALEFILRARVGALEQKEVTP